LRSTEFGPWFTLHSSFICAGKPGSDACLGDGGGPLVCPMATQPQRWVQIGLVSWGVGCGTAPGVYTNLAKFSAWLVDTLGVVSREIARAG